MAGRIVLFGATGYTGRLTTAAMLRRGIRPVLAGRSRQDLDRLSAETGADLPIADAKAGEPESLARHLGPGDVLVSTVGPFTRLGDTAASAAIAARAHYLDSNGEPPFTRRVFEHYGRSAHEAGVALLPAFGWENVVGNLAAGLALTEAGGSATRVEVGYFYLSRTRFSSGTRASFLEAAVRPSFAYRDGRLRTVRGGERLRAFDVAGRRRSAISLGASEHLSLPRVFPELQETNAYLGWFGGIPRVGARAIHLGSRPGFALMQMPAVGRLVTSVLARRQSASGRGPEEAERMGARTRGVAVAHDGAGRILSEVHVDGPEGYELTAELLAAGAGAVAPGAIGDSGALGPVEAFGIAGLEEMCRECGLRRVDP